MSPAVERHALQIAMAVACMVPLLAGGDGMIRGAGVAGVHDAAPNLDSHMRYLSGLLFAIGLGFLSAIPTIERQGARVRLLAALVVVGGLARLAGAGLVVMPDMPHRLALIMELGVTPGLALWQARVARRYLAA